MRTHKVLKSFLVLIFTAMIFVLPHVSFADTADKTASPTSSDIHEIDSMTPGSRKVLLGVRLRGMLQTNATTNTDTTANTDTCAFVPTQSYISPFTRTYIEVNSFAGGGQAICLGDGYQNEMLTFVLKTDASGQGFMISPYTKTGFSTVKLTATKASVTLVYSDTTNGWQIDGSTPSGVTVN